MNIAEKGGPSPNPKGRPKIPVELKQVMGQIPAEDYKKVVRKLTQLAKKGNTRAIELFLDRWAGKVSQPVELPGVTFVIKPRNAGSRD